LPGAIGGFPQDVASIIERWFKHGYGPSLLNIIINHPHRFLNPKPGARGCIRLKSPADGLLTNLILRFMAHFPEKFSRL